MLILGIIWVKKDFLNTILKIVLFLMGLIGLFYYLQLCGYIVKQI